ncbi:coadhesin-like [Mercenaria mercenaria]|uniref:coadhesin-like n=1 Tax=Mercenaria mercenaria TaxID=6596 RepID=UPI00234EDB17|nr:coadhesin-like [Mercenaria mercenaria]
MASIVLLVFLLTSVRSIASLECYSCTSIDDLESCHNISQCHQGQACYTNSHANGQTRTFTLGCIDNQQCGTITAAGGPGIVGRDINERQTDNCHECCGSDHCNNRLCSHLKPSACIDDAKVDCPFLSGLFNICQDIHHAKTVCPKFRQLCSLVDGNWAEWSQWSECDVTCETGQQTRKRTCTNPAPENKGLDCEGNSTDFKVCLKQPCPVHGGWTLWSEWEKCSVTCDVGIQRRHRNCSNPYPSKYGDHCFGDTLDDRICMPGPCSNGGWSTWAGWTSCSLSCGGGLRSHSRSCTNPRPSSLGKFCDGTPSEVELCNTESCDDGPVISFMARTVTKTSGSNNEVMIFSSTVLNEGGAYHSSNGTFYTPVNGVYHFNVHLCSSSQNTIVYGIFVNNQLYMKGIGYYERNSACGNTEAIVKLSIGDTVNVRHGDGGNYRLYQDDYRWNSFTGFLVRKI